MVAVATTGLLPDADAAAEVLPEVEAAAEDEAAAELEAAAAELEAAAAELDEAAAEEVESEALLEAYDTSSNLMGSYHLLTSTTS